MPRYLFDTDALSFVIGGRLPHYPAFAHFLEQLPRAAQFTCTPVVAELHAGAWNSPDPPSLLRRIEQTLARLTVLPFDRAAAERYGRIRATLESAGTPLADMDLTIAACALSQGLTLVTGNQRHFARIAGLSLWPIPVGRVKDLLGTLYRADRPSLPKRHARRKAQRAADRRIG
jgi:tRNA(fMet)-specific endonuclease VapC